jgi:hypothetical protein
LTLLVRTAHRLALALSVVLLVLAVSLGSRYYRQHGGWDLASGSTDLMTTMVTVIVFIMASSFAVIRPGGPSPNGARLTAIIWSLALLGGLLFTWRVIITSHRWAQEVGTPVTSAAEMAAFEQAHPTSFAPKKYRIPTGVFLQSFEFLTAHNVELSGYVWQYYGPDVPSDITRGVVLPEAVEEAYQATEAWRIKDADGGEHIGWYFNGQFRQNFDYRLYPFDPQSIWIRVWHPDPDRPVLLVPDFAAYSNLAPETLPGIEKNFVFGGWDPLGSGFSYDLISYNTNFGRGGQRNGIPYPDLFFNLEVERDSLGPMLEHVVLQAAIAILLFLLLVLMEERSAAIERVGLTIFDLIVAAGGLLFAVILDLNSIRGAVESQELTYLEYFPLVVAVFIVLVVLSAVLRIRGWRVPLLGYTGDLVPVLAYWPALLGTLLVVTLRIFFYP